MNNITWQKTFSLLNRKCSISGENLFFKTCYKGKKCNLSLILLNNGHLICEEIWISKKVYSKLQLEKKEKYEN